MHDASNASIEEAAISLFRFRRGDSDMRSVWLCSHNDVAGKLAVLLAASGVFATDTASPDSLGAALMATLYLTATAQVVQHALTEVRAGSGVRGRGAGLIDGCGTGLMRALTHDLWAENVRHADMTQPAG